MTSHRTTDVVTKSRVGAPPGFFAAEARGLRWLGEVEGGPALPAVIEVTDDRIAVERVNQAPPTHAAADGFGRALATMHRAGHSSFGLATDGFIGPLPLDNTPSDDWPRWYAERRVLPFVRRAVDGGGLDSRGAKQIERACERLPQSEEPPARIHGDLWSGNVLWGADGQVWLIDAGAAHGGHRETDLAMLALFGLPYLDRVLAAYDEAWPLTAGWRDRIGLHQLHPLLVHAALFGGGYGARAVAVANL